MKQTHIKNTNKSGKERLVIVFSCHQTDMR